VLQIIVKYRASQENFWKTARFEKTIENRRVAVDTQSIAGNEPISSIGSFGEKINPVSSIDLI